MRSVYENNKPNSKVTYGCHKCGKRHEENSDAFRVVYGDITVGLQGGIVGGNFAEDNTLIRSSLYCTQCLIEIIKWEKR